MSSRLPDFLIGGANNSGTSFLFSLLQQHPEIFLPREMRPEPAFFFKSWEYEQGLDYYQSRWFSDIPESALSVGEKSTNYLFGGSVTAERIARDLPDVKIIFLLRNPIERAWANYRFTVLEGLEDLSFEEALQREDERRNQESGRWKEIQPRNYSERGLYARKISEFLAFFPRSQIHIVKFESLVSDLDTELHRIYSFLGVHDTSFITRLPPTHTSVSVRDAPLQTELRRYFDTRFDRIIEAIRKEEDFSRYARTDRDKEMIEKLRFNLIDERVRIPDAARVYLRELFTEDMEKLKGMVNFDISDWQ